MAFARTIMLLGVLLTLVGCAKDDVQVADEAPDAGDHYDLGVAAVESEDYDLAIREFTKAIESAAASGQEYPGAFNGRGTCWKELGNYERAFADFDTAIQLDPGFADAYFDRGLAYFNTRAYDKALADYDTGIKLNPHFASAWHNRGAIFQDRGEYGAAIAQYTKAIELDPDYVLAYCNRANAEYSFGMLPIAIEDFVIAASICARNGDFESAVKWQSEASGIATDEQKAKLYAKLREYMMQAGARADES